MYNYFCNFCGKQFEVGRWDAKTCSHGCRTRLARISRFQDGVNKVHCIICNTEFSQAERKATCGDECQNIVNELKVHGITNEIQAKIRTIIDKPNEGKGVVKKIFRRKQKIDQEKGKE